MISFTIDTDLRLVLNIHQGITSVNTIEKLVWNF